jgi:TonB family protein
MLNSFHCTATLRSCTAAVALYVGVLGSPAAQPSCAPKPIATPPAVYTDELRRAEISGTVYFQFRVLPDGTVSDVQALDSSRKELVPAVLHAVGQWRFAPHNCSDSGFTIRSQMRFALE